MVFDANAYEATVRDYHRQGDMTALEGYLTQEIARLRESGTICAGVACTCGKDADALAEEDAAWQHNREQGLVAALSDLADLYRSSGAWYKCLETYEELRQCLIDEGLENTPAYASALVNAGYACLDATDPERAARLIEEALNALGDPDPEVPTAVLRARAHDALAVSWAMRGFAEQAEQASDAAAEAVSVCCATGEDFIGALSNHIATLAQIGRVDEAVSTAQRIGIRRADSSGTGPLHLDESSRDGALSCQALRRRWRCHGRAHRPCSRFERFDGPASVDCSQRGNYVQPCRRCREGPILHRIGRPIGKLRLHSWQSPKRRLKNMVLVP